MMKEDMLNIAWWTTIDSIRQELDEHQGKMASSDVMKMIMKRIAPNIASEPRTVILDNYMDSNANFETAIRLAHEARREFF